MNMIDRLARAISGAPFPSKAAYRKADAVLDELMTPTEGMESAAWDAHEEYEKADEGVWLGPKSIFTAMIKAAKEGK